MVRGAVAVAVLGVGVLVGSPARAEVPSVLVGPRVASAAEPYDAGTLYVRERERYLDGRRVFLASLATWGGTSLVAGGAFLAFGREPFPQWYGAQTLAWGAVNTAIAVVGLATTSTVRAELRDREAVFAERRSMQRFLWVNVALDALYVTTGALLLGLGTSDAVRGNGAAILTQGGFLLGFDALGSFTQGPRAPLRE